MVNACAELAPNTGFGLTDMTVGAATGAFTWKLYWFDASDPFDTLTHHVAAVVPNIGSITIWVGVTDTIGRLGYVFPGFPSVTVVVELKPVPWIVNACAELDPTTGFGLTDVT